MRKKIVMAAMVVTLALAQSTAAFASGSSSSRSVVVQTTNTANTLGKSGNEATIGDTRVTFVQGEKDAVAGLPEATANIITSINKGVELSTLKTGLDLTGYKSLNGTRAVMTYKAGTKIEKTGAVKMDFYVPNLVDGLGIVQVLFYNNMTGRWQLLQPNEIDTKTKMVTVTLPNSGTISVVYKK